MQGHHLLTAKGERGEHHSTPTLCSDGAVTPYLISAIPWVLSAAAKPAAVPGMVCLAERQRLAPAVDTYLLDNVNQVAGCT